jgi:steroid delta-isomerase-like uncharacterized protein
VIGATRSESQPTKKEEAHEMSAEENQAIARTYINEVWNEGKLDRFDEFFSPDVIPHSSPEVTNAETMKQGLAMIRNAFPDIRFTLDDELADDGKVVHRWTISGTHQGELLGIPASGKNVVWSGISIFRLSGGKIVEYWAQSDNMGMMQQLGAVPARGG